MVVFAQDNWKEIVKKNYNDNKHSITGFNEQMMKAWEGGMYYQAGQLAGLIAAIEFDMPDPVPVPVHHHSHSTHPVPVPVPVAHPVPVPCPQPYPVPVACGYGGWGGGYGGIW